MKFGISRRGFTIVELLVVLAIIALLMSVSFALFSTARAKGRDAKREEDVKSIQSALAIYVTNAGVYPTTSADGVCLSGQDAVSLAIINAGAVNAMPRDPQQNCGTGLPTSANPHYHYAATDGFSYVITYNLETSTVPGKSAGQQTVGP